MKTTIKIDPNLAYQVDMKQEGAFILLNGIEINKRILQSLLFIQGDEKEGFSQNQGYYEIAAGYAELISLLLEHIGYDDKRLHKSLDFLQLQINELASMKAKNAPGEMVKDQQLNYCN